MVTTTPRLLVLRGALPAEPSLQSALASSFHIVEVASLEEAQTLLTDPLGAYVLWSPDQAVELASDMAANGASAILQRIGEGVAVVDASGAILWADRRFRELDEPTRTRVITLCKQSIDQYNQTSTSGAAPGPTAIPLTAPAGSAGRVGAPTSTNAADRRRPRRYGVEIAERYYELVVSPQNVIAPPANANPAVAKHTVTSVVGVLWEATAAHRLQEKLHAIDAAGSELLRIEPATIARLNMAERLKLLEDKIVRTVRELLKFDNFEVRLIDPQSGRLELVIAINISPLKIGEVMYARPEGNGISGYVASTGKSYMCSDVQNDPMYREGLDNAASSLTVPLFLHDKVVGVFNIESYQANAFNDNDRMFAEIFGRYIATAMNILNLLVVERYTTNEQVAQNVLGELNSPLTDLANQVETLRSSDPPRDELHLALDRIRDYANIIRTRIQTCTAGSKAVLAAEQDLQRLAPGPLFAGKRVLVADDEPAIRETLGKLLNNLGCNVTVCANGVETLEALDRSQATGQIYDLIVSDIRMPDRNGYEVFRAAKAIKVDTPVILMTGFGYDPHHSIVRSSQEGLHCFLFKPFRASQLLEQMTKIFTPAK